MFLFALLLGLLAPAPAAPAQPVAQRAPAASAVSAPRAVSSRSALDAIVDAIRFTESGGLANGGRDAIGDGGRALGPFQIHRAYFIDAGIAGRYEDCRDPDFSRRVVIGYWKRWCPEALERCDAEVLARVHNGGPNGARNASTLGYWRKVEGALRPRS